MNFAAPRFLMCATVISGLALVALPAAAQTVPAKAGLWASASQVQLNGKAMPTIFDIKGVPDAKKAQLRQAMSAAGLPAGWSPSINCQQETQVDLQKVFADLAAQGCNAAINSQTGDHISANLQCKNENGTAAGTTEVSGIGSSTVTYVANLNGTMYGKPLVYKSMTISKFIGSDCSALPAGVTPDMLNN